MNLLESIRESLRHGNSGEMRKDVIMALETGISHQDILKVMLNEMEEVGRKFKINELFVPEVLIISRAFNVALEVIQPLVSDSDAQKGLLLIGTVKGDIHDVGKNLVKMLVIGVGVKVIDLGVDVSPENFIEAIRKYKPDLLGMSALLTTTMTQMSVVIKALEKEGLRDQIKIIVGGAPVTQSYAEKVGADYFAADAGSAAEVIRAYFIDK